MARKNGTVSVRIKVSTYKWLLEAKHALETERQSRVTWDETLQSLRPPAERKR